MQIIDMNALPIGAVALDIAAKAENEAKAALVIARVLDENLLEEFCGAYGKLYVCADVDPVVDVLIELGRWGCATNADVFVLPTVDSLTERVFMRGYITSQLTKTKLQKALAA